jgi:LPXTG-motif cell wall-anchored protein
MLGLALLPSMAHAIGFGEMVSQSAIGAPFRAEFRLFGVDPNIGADCLRVVSTEAGDGIPQLRGASVQLKRDGRDGIAVVTRAQPVSDPIIRVTLEERCLARLQRTYTLLLPMSAAIPQAPVAAAPPTARPAPPAAPAAASAPSLGSPYTLAAPTSLDTLARRVYPRSRADRDAFIAALRSVNQGDRSVRSTRRPLAAGATLMMPSAAEIEAARDELAAQAARAREAARRAPPPAPQPPAPSEPAPPAEPTPATEPAPPTGMPPAEAAEGPDRLVLAGDAPESSGFTLTTRLADPSLIERTTEAEREVLRREQQLIMAVDSQIMARMELSDRIARLEALQDALRAEMAATDPAAPATDAPPAGTDAPAPSSAQPPAPEAAPPSARPQVAGTPTQPPAGSFDLWLPAAGALLLALLGLLWWRRRQAEQAAAQDFIDEPFEDEEEDTEAEAVRQDAASVEGDTRDLPKRGAGDSFDFSVLDWEGPPPAELEHSVAPIDLEEEERAEEHESAVELADIMMSFGRVQGAAETLAEFIRGNPKKAVQPWIKLLEVYKAADMRGEFDALSRKLNQTFNVKAVTWDSFESVKEAADSVEQMPHIIQSLQQQWMSVDCQRYLQVLLRDNRGGTREGFPLGVIDDLLLLQAVLEDQLGPYRPSEEEIAAALRGPDKGSPQDRRGDPAGIVAPPAALAPDRAAQDKPSPGDEDRQAFEFDAPSARTELPDLDFQLDSGEVPPLFRKEEAPKKDPEGDEENTDLWNTWVLPTEDNDPNREK